MVREVSRNRKKTLMAPSKKCWNCRGSGTEDVDCSKCGGSGEVDNRSPFKGPGTTVECSKCRGSGKTEKRCYRCGGTGEM